MKTIVCRAQVHVGNVRVDLRGREIAVPEQHLHDAQIGAVVDQVHSESMAQSVRRQPCCKARLARIALDDVPERLARHGATARRDEDFMVIARTDARAVEDFDRAVERARLYLKAGADAIFPEALQSADEFKTFAREVKAPLLANMTEFGKSPLLSSQELSDFGYRMVIFPQSAFRVSMKATEEFLRDLKKAGTQSGWIQKMQTREQLYKLLDYDPAAESWKGGC